MPRQSGILKILISLLANPKTWVYIQNIVSKQRFEFCEGGFPVAKQIEGAYDAVLARTKEEFLDKGYQEASLRTIAQKAGTSTGPIYTRLGDKEGLFEAIVQPVVICTPTLTSSAFCWTLLWHPVSELRGRTSSGGGGIYL